MAGIYIHIPFCRQACHYCDFHFSVKQEGREKIVFSLIKEMELQQDYLQREEINTIYLGGGTPSLLSQGELERIFDGLHHYFNIDKHAEITLEANPDDLTIKKIEALKLSPVNRLSIGIQSFFDTDLKWMNRAHSSQQALSSVKDAQAAGFNNVSIDLIYGLPDSNVDQWKENLSQAFELNVQHLSCYCLTIEPRTALASFIKSGKSKNVDDELSATQFEMLISKSREAGWQHYEISNFCKPDFFSRHNAAYWTGQKYLGLGPSAHSYNGISRQWNISHNYKYAEAIENGIVPFEDEILTPTQQLNERIMTSLRTMWGLDLTKVHHDFGKDPSTRIHTIAKKFEGSGHILFKDQHIQLTDHGKLIADRIILELISA